MSEFIDQMARARDTAVAEVRAITDRAKAAGREQLTAAETREVKSLIEQKHGLDQHISDAREAEEATAAGHAAIARLTGRMQNRAAPPIQFPEDQLRRAFEALSHGESARLEARDFSTAQAHLPPQLWGLPVGPVFEARLLAQLPTMTMNAPSMEFVLHTTTTGTPAIVAEGGLKPELVFATDKKIVTAQKLAAHSATSYETLSDFPSFASYANGELVREVVRVENDALLNSTTGIVGFLHTPDILSYAKGDLGETTSLDAVEIGISNLRTGASLAEADLLVIHPATWSAIRREKDLYGRYLVNPDPRSEEASQVWGVKVLATTQIAGGTGLLMANGGDMNSQDTGLASWGNVLIRESLNLRVGWSGDDLTRNLLRSVLEERLNLAVSRPTCLLKLSGLPTGIGELGS